ncbi:MAG: nitrous oxide-stimulated promoter family protein [Alistipes sp.]|nr:nitrous oxide-stimulated promoter family protein [Alistipes sp.]
MSKIEREKQIVSLMIRIYCRRKEGNSRLCDSCAELERYAHARLERCSYGEEKTSCKRCPKHCYKRDMRAKIRDVMRFSGPRMLLYHPIEALRHLL